MKIKIKKTDFYMFLFVFVAIFDHIIGYINYDNRYFITGNLNLLYFLAICFCLTNKNEFKSFAELFVILCIYAVFQCLFVGNVGFSLPECLINISKISICFIVYRFFGRKKVIIDYDVAVKRIVIILCGIFIVALFWRSKYLWRLDETINKYTDVRLKLLYNEPSEIGLHVGLVIVVLIGLYLDKEIVKKSFIIMMIPLLLILTYAKPMLGLATIIITSVFMYLKYCFKRISLVKFISLLILGVAIICGFYYLQISDNEIAQRFRAILEGSDASSRYRIQFSFMMVKNCLMSSKGVGVGFSRLTSTYYMDKYSYLGLTSSGLTASFYNFVAETGIFGIACIIILVLYTYKKIRINFNYTSFGMILFITIYQFMGTYFTNPLCWMIYGLAVSHSLNYKRKKEKQIE